MSATQYFRNIDLARSSFARHLGTCARVGLAMSLAALTACSTDESVLDRALLDDNPACVGTQGYALGDAPPAFTLQDIGYTLTVLGQLQAAVTPLVAMGLPPEPLFSGSWTNWSSETDIRNALAKLGVMRGILDKGNLWDLYAGNIHPALNVAPVPGVHPGTARMPAASCNEAALTNRTIDGTCNDLANPSMGARGIRFGRNIMPFLPQTVTQPDGSTTTTLVKNPAAQADPNLMSPSPREVSRHLFTTPSGDQQQVPFLNTFAAAWIQFQVHDWFDHGESNPLDGFRIPLAPDDPFVKKFKIASLYVPKTKPDASRTPIDNVVGLPPTFQNDVTHWWDASQVYGSDAATAQRLREGVGGRLKLDANGLLPKASDGFDDTGFRRNWWIGLAVMHNLFAKEHNAIAAMLAAKYPNWTDQQLYDKARMINAALIVKIHTVEWTPAILPNKALEIGMNANWYGLEKFIQWGTPGNQPLPPLVFKQAFGIPDTSWPDVKPIVYGVAGGDRDLKKNPFLAQAGIMQDVPYTLTEEFVSVYRMHTLLVGKFPVKSLATGTKVADYLTGDTRNAGARKILETHPMTDLLYTMGERHPGALVLNNYPQFIQELDIPLIGKMDMGTVDILRDRERGIPRYNAFRANLRMKPVASFEELTGNNTALVAKLKKVYGSDPGAINRMDALVGTLAEGVRPSCYGFGETLFQVFTVMATRRIQADRFLTTDYTPAVYTPEGINWVETNSFKSVLLRHYPELANSGLSDVKNAFFPWD